MSDRNELCPDWMRASDFAQMLDDRTAGTFFWDRQRDAVQWSPRLMSVLGYSEQEARNLVQVEKLHHPDDVQHFTETLQKAIDTESNYSLDVRLRNAQGEYQPFRAQGFWLRHPDEPMRYLAGYMTEISEVADLRNQVDRIERLFQAFFHHAPAAAYIKDSSRTHIYGNPFAAKIAGCTLDEFIGSSTAELFDEATDRALLDVDRRILDSGQTVVRHGEFETPNGEKHYVYDTTFPLEDPLTGEKLIGGFGLDTTRQHEAEIALAQTQKMDALGQLVGGIAHDFNNTLAVLQGNLDLIAVADGPKEVEESIAQIAMGVERGTRLTKQLLAYARQSVLAKEIANLNAIVDDVVHMLRRVIPVTIEVETIAGDALWNSLVDRSQVESALLNVALNARDAMPDGGTITIETSNVRLESNPEPAENETVQSGRFVRLAVTDTGTGMSDDVAGQVFDPFFTTKPVGEGTGMGLSMIEGFMRQIGGSVSLVSELGSGTTVELFFPVSDDDVKSVGDRTESAQRGDEHILLAEDDPAVRAILYRQLSKLGYRVTEAESGDEAFDIIQSNPDIQLLMTDIVMPGRIQGPELASRARELRHDLPVVFMSGYPRDASAKGNGLQPDSISLTKPVRAADIALAVRSALDQPPS